MHFYFYIYFIALLGNEIPFTYQGTFTNFDGAEAKLF